MNGWDCLAHVADDGVQVALAMVPLGAIWLRDFLKSLCVTDFLSNPVA